MKKVRETSGSNFNDKNEELENEEKQPSEPTDPATKLPLQNAMAQRLLTICNENNQQISASLLLLDIYNIDIKEAHNVADAVGLVIKKQTELNNGIEAFRYYEGGTQFAFLILGKDQAAVVAFARNIQQSISNSTKANIGMQVSIRAHNESKDVWFQRAENGIKKHKAGWKKKEMEKADHKIAQQL
eukprot:UN07215